MRLRRPCEHDRYDPHVTGYASPVCPGGEFLPEDAINRFEVIDHTGNGEGRILSKWESFNFDVAFDLQDGGRTLKVFLSDALAASQVEEPGTTTRGVFLSTESGILEAE